MLDRTVMMGFDPAHEQGIGPMTLKIDPSIAALDPQEYRRERSDHEAGHYVMLLALGIEHVLHLISVEIQETGEGGCVSFTPRHKLPTHDFAVQNLAGFVAQIEGIRRRKNIGEADPMTEHSYRVAVGAGNDFGKIRKRTGLNEDLILARFYNRARGYVNEWWGSIEAVSDALVEKGKLSHKEASRLATHARTSGRVKGGQRPLA